MTVPSNTYQSVSVVGNREDLVNMVFNVDPEATVLQTAIKKTKATNTLHEWLTDTLASASATNAAIQGDDATAQAATPAVRLGNYTQIATKTAQVAGTNQAVNSAASVGKMGYQLLKRTKEAGSREILTVAALIYFLLAFPCTVATRVLELRLARARH